MWDPKVRDHINKNWDSKSSLNLEINCFENLEILKQKMKYRKYTEFHTISSLPVKCELHCTKDDDQMLMFDLNCYANINTEQDNNKYRGQ